VVAATAPDFVRGYRVIKWSWARTEVINKGDIIALHYNTRGDEDTPEDSLGVELDTLAEGHVTLFVSCGAGMLDNVDVCLARTLNVHTGRGIGGSI
jgi:hypothetical protein